jgi:membrane-associated phospholipid phosphatase
VGQAAVSWAALIGLSTLYTKQHYAVDVVAGVVAAVVAYAIFLRSHPRESVAVVDRQRAPLRALTAVGVFAAAVVGFWIAYQIDMRGFQAF